MSQLLSTEQHELQTTLRRFLSDTSPMGAVRTAADSDLGFDRRLWNRLSAELGITSLAVPERYGGAGCSLVELSIAAEELGRALVPGPFLSSGVFATRLLLELGDTDACAELLPGIGAGDVIAGVVLGDQDPQVHAEEQAGTWTVSGTAAHVLTAAASDILLVPAEHDGGRSVFVVDTTDPNMSLSPLDGLDPTRRQSALSLDDASARRIVADDTEAALARMLDAAAVCLAAELLGVIGRSVEMTVEYAKNRVQFGRVIGSFQAVKHGCADMWVQLELATSAVRHAASLDGSPELAAAATLALLYCSAAATEVTADMIQYHGGIAYTWEHDAHLYYRRARAAATLLGTADRHRRQLADRIGL